MSESTPHPLPCPFCGNAFVTIEPPPIFDVNRYVQCADEECAAIGPHACSRDDAVLMWNTRIDHITEAERTS